jgi:hypothetical protein
LHNPSFGERGIMAQTLFMQQSHKKLNPDINSFINLIIEKYPAYMLYFNNNDLKDNKMALCMRGL